MLSHPVIILQSVLSNSCHLNLSLTNLLAYHVKHGAWALISTSLHVVSLYARQQKGNKIFQLTDMHIQQQTTVVLQPFFLLT